MWGELEKANDSLSESNNAREEKRDQIEELRETNEQLDSELEKKEQELEDIQARQQAEESVQVAEASSDKAEDPEAPSEEENQEVESESEEVENTPSQESQGGNFIGEFQATAYAVGAWGVPGTETRDGTDISNTIHGADGHRIIATDPSVIPLGSVVRVVLPNGEEFTATSRDTGGRIQGQIIDILFATPEEATQFGRQNGIEIYRID